MKLGVYTAVPHDKTIKEAVQVIKELGLTSAEDNRHGLVDDPAAQTLLAAQKIAHEEASS